MSILDLSKTLMYDFHYNYMKKNFGLRANMLFTDTDSLCYEIQTEDFYKIISDDVQVKFDTSNFPQNHPSDIPSGINKKVPGMFKDEAGGETQSLLDCEQSNTQSRNSMVRRTRKTRASREMS